MNPIEMLWRQFRREVTHCELFESLKALLNAAQTFFDRYSECPLRVLSIIGAIQHNLCGCTQRLMTIQLRFTSLGIIPLDAFTLSCWTVSDANAKLQPVAN